MGERDRDRLDGDDVMEDGFEDWVDGDDGFENGFDDLLEDWVDEGAKDRRCIPSEALFDHNFDQTLKYLQDFAKEQGIQPSAQDWTEPDALMGVRLPLWIIPWL